MHFFMIRLIIILTLSLVFQKIVFGQQLDWNNYSNDTLVAIGTYLLADEKIYVPKDTVLFNKVLHTNVDEIKVQSFVLTAFSLGHSFEEKSENNILSNSMLNAIKDQNIKYKFVNFKHIVLINQNGETFTPGISKIKVVFTD